jgi:hypothetical protein
MANENSENHHYEQKRACHRKRGRFLKILKVLRLQSADIHEKIHGVYGDVYGGKHEQPFDFIVFATRRHADYAHYEFEYVVREILHEKGREAKEQHVGHGNIETQVCVQKRKDISRQIINEITDLQRQKRYCRRRIEQCGQSEKQYAEAYDPQKKMPPLLKSKKHKCDGNYQLKKEHYHKPPP